ncbi:MAG: hypothetical protein ACK4Z6_05840, partial [Candidatus Methylomirabilales bacterium]
MKGRWTIQRKLIALVLATLLPFLALSVYGAYDRYREEKGRIQKEALNLATLAAQEADGFVASVKDLLTALAGVKAIKDRDGGEATKLFAELKRRHPRLENIFAYDGN